ncbi:SH3 domain-containing protein [Leptospira meyeri]|uniref:SH3 domain-containing protein n=1 Tax=Leptospira meyeri TaxID=29508 RepID=UPI0010824B43|nr:SH3 domain-containing protein [Leptospira meyeri]
MGTRFLILLVIIFNVRIESKDLFPIWRDTLKNFNYDLPEELYKRYKNFGYEEAGFFNESKGIFIRKAKFRGEDINYAIGIRNQNDKLIPDEVFLVFYFKNSEFIMLSKTIPYVHKSGDYSFAGAIHRIGRTYEYEKGKLIRVSCLDRDQDLNNAIEISKKEYCGEIIHLDEFGNVNNVEDSKNPCSYVCNSRYMPYSQPGVYFTTIDQLKLRQFPSSKSEVIQSLHLNTKVQVIEDTFKAERLGPYVNGNWVKIKLENEKEGFVYGFYLRYENEPNLNQILLEAELWKKAKNKK